MAERSTPIFHIAVSGSAESTYPSFKSTDLGERGFTNFSLANVRNKCNISSKLLFTADGTTSVDDHTTLVYYMSLSAEGQSILQFIGADAGNAGEKNPPPALVPTPSLPLDQSAQPPAQEPVAPKAGVPTFVVKVLGSIPTPAAMPDTTALENILEQVSKASFLQRGALPAFAKADLASLKANYAATVSTTTYPEPAELQEAQWDTVLKNTRAFHGYYFDFSKKGVLVKAPKPAFRLRPASGSAVPVAGATANGVVQDKYNPPLPPFYIFDTSSVKVTEISGQFQDTLVKEGFNSLAVSGSLGGGVALPVSVSAAFDNEHSWAHQKKKQAKVDTLAVTYNFPRVVVDLDATCLELTPECSNDASGASDEIGVERFRRAYGTVFATSFTLGGFLHSTLNVTEDEQSRLDQVKDQTRTAAGVSFTTPKVSGSFGVGTASGTGAETGHAQLHQEARLTWDAHGGNTLLASNPSAWVSTVKDHRLWRLMDQQRVVEMFALVKEVNPAAYDNLTHPTSISHQGKDPIADQALNRYLRTLLMNAILAGGKNSLVTQMEDYYHDNKYDALPANKEFNTFMKTNYPQSPGSVINPGIKYQGLDESQRVFFGLFMASKRVLQYS